MLQGSVDNLEDTKAATCAILQVQHGTHAYATSANRGGICILPLFACQLRDCTVVSGLGAHFSQTNQTTEDYFLGNRGLPGWAVGFSLLSTTMSSVTFLAYPATSYLLDWRYGLYINRR